MISILSRIKNKLGLNKYRGWWMNWSYMRYLKKHPKGCNFCTLEDNKLVAGYKHWNIIECKWPYRFNKEHLLLISKRHVKNQEWYKLNEEERKEFFQIRMIYNDWSIQHNGREGQSVSHLHCHLMK